MLAIHTLPQRLAVAAIALAALITPLSARAQDIPSYAQPATISTDETIHGRIRSVDGAFNISVDDDRGFVDNIELHQGTIINPTGLSLSPGMSVTITGFNSGSTFDANQIDTPYSYSGPLPTPVYLGPGYWCPGFAYGYGPSFSLAIVIGGGGGGGYGPYSFVHHPFYGRPWNGHGYFGGYVGRGPGNSARVQETRAIESERRVPSAFENRAFAGDSRPTTERYPSTDAHYAHGPQPAAGYGHEASGAYTHGGAPAYARPAPSGSEHGAAGGFSHGAPSENAHGGGGGGFSHSGGAPHGGGGGGGGGHPH